MTAPAPIATNRPLARTLAEFAVGLRVEDLPASARERTKDLLLDALAAGLAGVGDPGTATVTGLARDLLGAGESTVLGGRPLSIGGATLVNGHLMSAVSLCDVHYATWCHLTPEVIPPAIAVGEDVDATGARFLVAIAAGCELTARIGLGSDYAALHAHGWNASGVMGVFGAATAAGLLWGQDAPTLTHALGIAGASASGSDAHRGTPTVRFHQPRAALNGLIGASLASRGFTAMDDVLGDPAGGLYATHADGGTPEAALDGLGERWELERVWLTEWPLALLIRNIVNTLLDLAVRDDLRLADVERVRITLGPRAYQMYARMPFDVPSRARTSPPYLAAVVLRDRRCDSDQFTPYQLQDPGASAFARERVEVALDPELPERAVRVDVRTRDGRVHDHERAVAHGDADDPLTREEIAAKFRKAAEPVLPASAVEIVLDAVEGLEALPSLRPLIRALRP